MDNLLKKIADMTMIVVAFLGLISFFPNRWNIKDILLLTGLILFLLFIILIVSYVSKIEKDMKDIEEKFKRADDIKYLDARVIALEKEVKPKK